MGCCTNMTLCMCRVPMVDGRCMPYNGAVCQHMLGVSPSVYVPAFIPNAITVTDSIIDDQLSQLAPQCHNVTIGTLCRYAYPECAGTAGVAKSKPLCRQGVHYSRVNCKCCCLWIQFCFVIALTWWDCVKRGYWKDLDCPEMMYRTGTNGEGK